MALRRRGEASSYSLDFLSPRGSSVCRPLGPERSALCPLPPAAPPQGSALLLSSARVLICPVVSGVGCGKTCKTTFMAVAGAQWLCL